ncbi:hypothetical protein C5C17_09080 [Pseudoclavibacter sp. RFBA6]|nr:hypothetical protein C5C17_09080 [Pseudoclavibacter sp. RFBA6]
MNLAAERYVALSDSSRRLAVLALRLRLEAVASEASREISMEGLAPQRVGDVKARLFFVLDPSGDESVFLAQLRVVHLARHIYGISSDVLHGRSSIVNLPPFLLAEWEAAVRDLEGIAQQKERGSGA